MTFTSGDRDDQRPTNTPELCPHGCGPPTPTVSMAGEFLSAFCNTCGWHTENNSRVYTWDEARQEVIDAGIDLLGFVHRSTASFAVLGIYRRPSEKLRDEAARIDAVDAALLRLERAAARLVAIESNLSVPA